MSAPFEKTYAIKFFHRTRTIPLACRAAFFHLGLFGESRTVRKFGLRLAANYHVVPAVRLELTT